MWWLVIFAGIYFCRGKIAQYAAPLLPNMEALRLAHYLHCLLLGGAAIYVLPLELVDARLGGIKRMLYLLSMWCSVGSCGITLKYNYGRKFPDLSGISLRNIRTEFQSVGMKMQPFLQEAMHSADFHSLFFTLIFLVATPSLLVLLILGRRSLWSTCTQCQSGSPPVRLFAMFKPTWEKLFAQREKVMMYAALSEVVLGISLAVGLAFPSRQIIICMLYWKYLQMKYSVPTASERKAGAKPKHQEAWAIVGQKTAPLFKALPFLNMPLNYAKNYFTKYP